MPGKGDSADRELVSKGVLIVGGSVAGLTVAETLREQGYTGAVAIIGSESELPYQRPPLSKQFLSGQWNEERVQLTSMKRLEELGIAFRMGVTAERLDPTENKAFTTAGTFEYEHLVIATGAKARTLKGASSQVQVSYLRQLDDAKNLKSAIKAESQILIVGAGVLGSEMAATLAKLGHRVTLVGNFPNPRLGADLEILSKAAKKILLDLGVELQMDCTVEELSRTPVGTLAVLSNGFEVVADLVIGAVGSVPNVSWLDGSGLDTSNGVLCDAIGRAASGIYAVGDVARWDNGLNEAGRIEHQMMAIGQAASVGTLIATGKSGELPVPYFWSELADHKALILGVVGADSEIEVVAGSEESLKFLAVAKSQGRIKGLVGLNMPKEFRAMRPVVERATRVNQGERRQ